MARLSRKNTGWWSKFFPLQGDTPVPFDHLFFPESSFSRILVQERRRAERSNRPLLIMVVNPGALSTVDELVLCSRLGEGIRSFVRATDICGAMHGGAIGVILTEIPPEKIADAKRAVAGRTKERIGEMLKSEGADRVVLSFRVYPETGDREGAFDMVFFPDVTQGGAGQTGELVVKRTLDILGSIVALLLLVPVFLVVPVVIKLTSDGPVFFAQERFGLNGKRFKMLKFRTMVVGNRDDIHREFVRNLIQGKMGEDQTFKITGDPRVTPVGRVLRKYSMDELPQLFNVVAGDMSLVGPRPPIAYEVEDYAAWQRNRLIGKKPGITGAWQVSGRSSTNFDEMVRLDLRYLHGWSVMLDIKILLQTPLAVLRCRGAY